jgi:hypothetical protein
MIMKMKGWSLISNQGASEVKSNPFITTKIITLL